MTPSDCLARVADLEREVRLLRMIRQAELLEIARYERLLSDLVQRTFPSLPFPNEDR